MSSVSVVIRALNEAEHITLCLASVLRQTLRPRRIVLVDDGSTDGTVEAAEAYCRHRGVELVAIRRRSPIGKTPTLKRQAWELDSDVEFILDGDTILESRNYIERTVQELYQGVGIASACGTVLPLRRRDRHSIASDPAVERFAENESLPQPLRDEATMPMLLRGVTNLYREVLYLFLQRFVYRGQMVFFGTITNPVGCAVAYRRKYVAALFDLDLRFPDEGGFAGLSNYETVLTSSLWWQDLFNTLFITVISVSIELVVLLPALFAVMFLGMQAALYYHAKTVAIAAAQQEMRREPGMEDR